MERRRSISRRRLSLPKEVHIERCASTNRGKRGRDRNSTGTTPAADGAMPATTPLPHTKRPSVNTPGSSPVGNGDGTNDSVAQSVVTPGRAKSPPPPPKTPPPKPTAIVKVLCGGSDVDMGRRWIRTLAHRDIPNAMMANTTPNKPGSIEPVAKEGGGYSVEYHKKDYSFQPADGAPPQTVRLQFLHLEGEGKSITRETPPPSWENTRHKVDSALLIVDLQHLVRLWQNHDLTCYLTKWRQVFDTWTYPQLPINLLVTNVSSNDLATPAILIRMGAAIARSRPYRSVARLFLVGTNAADGIVATKGLDSVDGILQSLIQQAMLSKSKKEMPLSSSLLLSPPPPAPPLPGTVKTAPTKTTSLTSPTGPALTKG